MFDIGWQELFIVAILALIVVGPKDLPHAIRTISTWIRKARMMTRDFQAGVNEMVREAELDDIKDTLTNPVDLKKTITDTIDADGDLAKALTLADDEKPDIIEKEDDDDDTDDDKANTDKINKVILPPKAKRPPKAKKPKKADASS